MSVTQIYRTYPEFERHKTVDRTRKRFVDGWEFGFFTSLELSDEFRELVQASQPMVGSCFLNAVRQATTVKFDETIDQDNYQFNIEIKAHKIRNILATKLDGDVMPHTRNRTPDQKPKLAWLSEILDSEEGIGFSFMFNAEANRVGCVKKFHFTRNTIWLERILLNSIKQMDNSIIFDKPERHSS